MYLIEKYVNVNVRGTSVLLDILANNKTKVKKVILSSSRAVYGEGKYKNNNNDNIYPVNRNPKNLAKGIFDIYLNDEILQLTGTDEESIYNPTSIYGLTKQMQEQLVLSTCQNLEINAIILRFQNVFGPGQSLKNPYTGILSIFSTQILNNNPINIFEDGHESRDFVFIDDVVNSIILSINYSFTNNEIFNVGTGVPVSVLQVAKLLIDKFDKFVPINISGNYRIGDIRHNYANIDRIKEKLNYLPNITFEQGLNKFVQWVKTQNIENDNYNDSISEMKKRGFYK